MWGTVKRLTCALPHTTSTHPPLPRGGLAKACLLLCSIFHKYERHRDRGGALPIRTFSPGDTYIESVGHPAIPQASWKNTWAWSALSLAPVIWRPYSCLFPGLITPHPPLPRCKGQYLCYHCEQLILMWRGFRECTSSQHLLSTQMCLLLSDREYMECCTPGNLACVREQQEPHERLPPSASGDPGTDKFWHLGDNSLYSHGDSVWRDWEPHHHAQKV